jgi:hypothetical protein
MSHPSSPDDPAPASELTRRPQPDGAHPGRIPPTDHRAFIKLRPGAPPPPGIAPDAQRYSPAVIEEARAGKKAVKRMVPDADGEYVQESYELIAQLSGPPRYSVPVRIFAAAFAAFAVAIAAMALSSLGRELLYELGFFFPLCVIGFVAYLMYCVVTGREPGSKEVSPSFLRLADPSVPLTDDDPISRPAERLP